jgi:hypothetical protein
MSSPEFRNVILSELAAKWSATAFFDLSDYTNLEDLPATGEDPVLLVQFIGGPETLATIATQGTHGWSETGTFYFHLLMPTGESSQRALTLGKQLRALFRGKRFGSFVIEALDPFTDFLGAAIRVVGKWHGWSASGSYYNVVCDGP